MIEYFCKDGHWQASPRPLVKCQAYVDGVACTGKLVAIGAGSRKINLALTGKKGA